jgi:hypothetical protein
MKCRINEVEDRKELVKSDTHFIFTQTKQNKNNINKEGLFMTRVLMPFFIFPFG